MSVPPEGGRTTVKQRARNRANNARMTESPPADAPYRLSALTYRKAVPSFPHRTKRPEYSLLNSQERTYMRTFSIIVAGLAFTSIAIIALAQDSPSSVAPPTTAANPSAAQSSHPIPV